MQNETVPCSYTDKPDANKACQFRIPALTNCTVANSYGFASGQPCIFLKMNKVSHPSPLNRAGTRET